MENTENINRAYCLKCKEKKEMHNCKLLTNKKGNEYLQSNCECGTKMNKFLKKDTQIDVDLPKE
jgi:hypothetical protein